MGTNLPHVFGRSAGATSRLVTVQSTLSCEEWNAEGSYAQKDEKTGRIYYELQRHGMEAKRRVSKRMKECQKDMEEKLLGILFMHSQIFGRRALRDLLDRTKGILSPLG